MAYFINNPINKNVKSMSLGNVTFHRVVANVSVGEMSLPQSQPVGTEGETVEFDFSAALRAYNDSLTYYNNPVTSSLTYDALTFTVEFKDAYMSGGTAQSSINSTWGSQTALLGGYTDFERMRGAISTSAESASFTLRPSTPFLIPSGYDHLCYRRDGVSRVATMRSVIDPSSIAQYDAGNGYPVPADSRWVAFQFVNSRGLHETAFAQCYSSEQIKGGTQTHVRALRETFSHISHRLGIPDPSYAALSFSSGFVDLSWAKWWSYEFCKSKHHWMLIDGIWLPCKVELKDGASVINRTKTELLSVEFDVVPDVDGLISCL